MIFTIGLWIYIITEILDSENPFVLGILSLFNLAGMLMMVSSVSIFAINNMT